MDDSNFIFNMFFKYINYVNIYKYTCINNLSCCLIIYEVLLPNNCPPKKSHIVSLVLE